MDKRYFEESYIFIEWKEGNADALLANK
jgi:hypothetical protein